MKPYTYRIRFTPTGEYYYGVRYAKDCDPSELWVKYFTSSAVINHLIDIFGKDEFTFEIRKQFTYADDAINWESRVNKYTRKWANYLNRTDAKSIGNQFGKKGGKLGGASCYKNKKGIHSDEHMLKKTEYSSMGGKASVEQEKGIHVKIKHWVESPSEELKAVRKKSGKKTGSKPWWNNGIKDTKSITCPGAGWVSGMLKKGNYWNNGTKQKVCTDCPGEGWVLGGLGTTVTGRKWWTNGTEQLMVFECPGPEWYLGKVPGNSAWWTNGITQCRQKDCPGSGWTKGMLKSSCQ